MPSVDSSKTTVYSMGCVKQTAAGSSQIIYLLGWIISIHTTSMQGYAVILHKWSSEMI